MPHSSEFLDKMVEAQDIFVWEAPSAEYRKRGPQWYLWMGFVAFVFAAYAVYTANYLFAFIILLIVIVIVLSGNEPPHPILIQIGQNGLVFDGRLYPFADMSDFAIIYQPPETRVLYIQPKSVFKPRLRIDLVEQDPIEIRNHLRRYVDEDLDLRDEHISDIIGRLLKM